MRPSRYQPGDKIGGRYQVHQALMGGMGEVYLCLDLETIQPFALKTFQQRFLTNPKLREAFENEVATWIALEKHPNIVRCFYMDTIDNQPFMFLEWVASEESRGADLRSWLRRGPLDLRLALDFTIDICRGLIHAQEKQQGIVHRDLKPENILVAQGRLAKITDWGLAKVVETAGLEVTGIESKTGERQSLWGHGAIVGTPPYMAPEQWHGEALDARADIYAIGCILYEMLTGNRPFQASTLDGLRRQHLESDIPKLADNQTWPDPRMNTLLPRCLAKRREERFTTASDLLQQLILIYEQRFAESPKTAIFLGGNEFTAADYNNRGATYHTLRRYDEALADCDRAIRIDPSFANAYVSRGVTYHSLQQDNKALADFSRAIRLDSKIAIAYGNRGVVYHALRRYNDALADYNRAIQLDPTLAGAHCNRGITYESLLRFDEALADYNKAIQLNQDLAEAYANRCAVFGAMNRLTEALSDADHAIRLNPTLPKAYMNRAVAYVMLNRFNEALADFARAVELDPDDPQVYYNRAKLHEILRRFDKALSDYDHAIQIDPNYSWAFNSRGHVHSLLNHHDRALSDFTRAIETDPNHVLAYTNRGTLYLQLNQYEKAISDFTRAIQIDPTNTGAYTNRGATYYQAGRLDEAFSDFKKATELDPSNALAYRNMGVLANERGLLQEALRCHERAAELGDAEAAGYVARARREAGTMSAPRDNLARMIRRLKSDEKFRQLFRSDPVRAVMEYELTIGEALELMASSDLPSGTIQDMEARLRLLEFIASYGDKK